MLYSKAAIYDAEKGRKSNAKSQSVNLHEFNLDDKDVGYDGTDVFILEMDVDNVLDVMMHSTGNGSKYQNKPSANQSTSPYHKRSGPRKVFMNFKTWKSLTPTDQKGWDAIYEDGKRKVSNYLTNCGKLAAKDGDQYLQQRCSCN